MSLSNDPTHTMPATSRLRKSRQRWRILAFIALAIAVMAIAGRFMLERNGRGTDQIARVVIQGVIATNPLRLELINQIADDDNVKAVIISINSPGGTTAGGEELFEAISVLRANKPVVAVVHELGASAAYMTAIASEHIFARRLSIVGSIGVLYQHIDAGKLLKTIGIDFDKVATGPLKAEPDIDEPLTGATRVSLQALVDDSFEWFVDIVADRRGLTRNEALELSDGRVLTGRMALKSQLIDSIGGEAEALEWLKSEKGVEAGLNIVTWFPLPENELERLTRYLGTQARSWVGLGPQSAITLDGLVSLWQAAASK